MPTQSDNGFREFSFEPSSRRTPASYNYQTPPTMPYTQPSNNQAVYGSDLSLLAHQFSQQSIQYDPRVINGAYPGSAVPYSQVTQAPTAATSHQTPYDCQPESLSSARSQRQAHILSQYQSSHTREPSSLVERMVATSEQSLTGLPMPRTEIVPPTWDEDETLGEEMDDDALEEPPRLAASRLSYRRSTDLTPNAQSYVAKSIRVRKKRHRNDQSRWR